MKIRYFSILKIVLLSCLIPVTNYIGAQTSVNDTNNLKTSRYLEKLYVHTDRDVYISGEQIWLKIYKLSGLTGFPDNVSKVIYVELLDGQSNPVNQLKIFINKTSGSAVIRLSDTLSSGKYLIRAYTRWMLNFPGDRDAYKPVFIINPFKKINNSLPVSESQVSDKRFAPQEETDKSVTNIFAKGEDNQIDIKIYPLVSSYQEREKVKFEIHTTDISGKPVIADLSVSVVKSSLVFTDGMNNFNGYLSDTLLNAFKKSQDNLPELEGEFLHGTVKSSLTEEPLKNTDISLSFVGKTARCSFSKTNDNGEFNFIIKDQFGTKEMVIQSLSKEIKDVYFDLDQPFSTIFDEYSFQFPNIDSARLAGINKAIISMQVNAIYEQFRKKSNVTTENTQTSDFYGSPIRRINMSDYIELTDVREIIKEILPEVVVFSRNKEIGLKVLNINPFESFENPALVLVDGIPVYNIDALLKVSAKELERIDIINARYYYKEFIFEGIVNFVTKKGNLSALESDNSVLRQVFEGFQKNEDFFLPDYNSDSLKVSTLPDFRNTLFWNSDIRTGMEGNAQVQFYTSDESGTYTIIIEGITSDGKRGITRIPLKVK